MLLQIDYIKLIIFIGIVTINLYFYFYFYFYFFGSVSGRKNFYISPLKESPFKAPRSPNQLTPASRQLYCFGDRHTVRVINL